ncbi:hypothetical protein [Dactylosporangium sp. CA-092794]|uniref:hypothetical protein n=1 Tax=Dactylosporangium sp. CA-092794 TaxID=3239929 RepID=UPI003D93AD2D
MKYRGLGAVLLGVGVAAVGAGLSDVLARMTVRALQEPARPGRDLRPVRPVPARSTVEM